MKFSTLTPVAVRQLQPGERITEHQITVTKLPGDERWSVAFMHHGERVHRIIGFSREGITRTKCVEWIEAKKAEIRAGQSSLPFGRKTAPKFGELASWYLDEMEATQGKNLKEKKRQIKGRLNAFFGDLPVRFITETTIGRYAKRHTEQGLSPSTVNRDLATLGHVFSTAVRRKKLASAPCRVSKLAEPLGRMVTLGNKEIDRLRKAAIEDCNPLLWLFVEVGLNTGMRASEISRARFDQIDWEGRRLYIPEAKSGVRHQPLTAGLLDILAAERVRRSDKDGWIFPKETSPADFVKRFNKPFHRAVSRAGLDPELITPHVMRHTAITKLVEAGAPLPTVQKISGHKTLAMVSRYTHLSDRHVDSAMEALERALHPVLTDR